MKNAGPVANEFGFSLEKPPPSLVSLPTTVSREATRERNSKWRSPNSPPRVLTSKDLHGSHQWLPVVHRRHQSPREAGRHPPTHLWKTSKTSKTSEENFGIVGEGPKKWPPKWTTPPRVVLPPCVRPLRAHKSHSGTPWSPTVTKVVDQIRDLADRFSKLNPETQEVRCEVWVVCRGPWPRHLRHWRNDSRRTKLHSGLQSGVRLLDDEPLRRRHCGRVGLGWCVVLHVSGLLHRQRRGVGLQ